MRIIFDTDDGRCVPDGKVLKLVQDMFDQWEVFPNFVFKIGSDLIITAVRAHCKRYKIEGVEIFVDGRQYCISPSGQIDEDFYTSKNGSIVFDSLLAEIL